MQLFKQHQVFDRVVLPGASHLLLATAAHLQQNSNASALELSDAIFEWLSFEQIWVSTWPMKFHREGSLSQLN